MGRDFFDYSARELDFAPFDIETTGFKASADDIITTIVLFHNDQYHVWLNTNERDVEPSHIRRELVAESGLESVLLYVCETEKLLLENMGAYLEDHTNDNTILTAFNGETYRGGFDIPFMRTRCFRNGIPWILDGFWFTDSYEVFSKQERFDTTVPAEPNLESMKRTDIEDFVDDHGFEVKYEKMLKNEIVQAVNTCDAVTPDMIESWADENGIERFDGSDAGSLTNKQLKRFIDEMSLDIPYDKLSKDEIIRSVREDGYTEDMLVAWHEKTGRDIGTEEMTTLDGIHEKVIADRLHDAEWRRGIPFEVEVFEPFDPYEDSGEAVTAYKHGEFVGLILHCFADVARTVNITRTMAEYVPQSDYRPKVL